MDQIKMKVISKEITGGTSTAEVTMDSNNDVTSVTSEIPPEIEVAGSDVTSDGASQGDILTADGSGGAAWQALTQSGGGHCYLLWYNRGSGFPLYHIYYFSPNDNLDFAGIRSELLNNGYTGSSSFLRVVGFYSPNYSGSWGSSSTVPSTVEQYEISGIYALSNVQSTIYIRGRLIKTTYDTGTKTIVGVEVSENPSNYSSFHIDYTTITKIF